MDILDIDEQRYICKARIMNSEAINKDNIMTDAFGNSSCRLRFHVY